MTTEEILKNCIYFFISTIIFVPIFRWLKLGPILAFLVAGVMLGPSGLSLISNNNTIYQIGEIGLILLMFVIGLELSPRRLATLKNKIFFEGTEQLLITTSLIMSVLFFTGQSFTVSFIVAISLSLSSTAFVLSYLKESNKLSLSYGQSSFCILLFQDIAIIPILSILPFLNDVPLLSEKISLLKIVTHLTLLAGLFIGLRLFLRPLISMARFSKSQEVFTAACLLVVFGMAVLVDYIGLSKASGAFIAGVFLSDSEFKHELENVINPFKVMLIGVFFLTFGMRFNLEYFFQYWYTILFATIGLFLIKSLVLFPLGLIRLKNWKKAACLSLLLCQGGEFSLVVISNSWSEAIISRPIHDFLVAVVVLGLFLAPLLLKILVYLHQADTYSATESSGQKIPSELKIAS